jgi:anti-sigma regulatory factor (Ser/Thr protein kinase)
VITGWEHGRHRRQRTERAAPETEPPDEPPWPDPDLGYRHVAAGFRDPGAMIDFAERAVSSAARLNEVVWAVVDPTSERELHRRLGPAHARVVFADPGGAHSYSAQTIVARRVMRLHTATAGGARATVVVQHGSPPEGEPGHRCRVDAGCNAALEGMAATLICLYPLGDDGRMAPDAYWNHPELLAGDTTHPNPDYLPPDRVFAANPTPPAPPLGPATGESGFGPGQSLRAVRAEAERYGTMADLGARRSQGLVLAVCELVNNSIEHGAGHGTVSWWVLGDRVVAQVHDAGRMCGAPPGLGPPEWAAPRGRGVWMARRVSETVHIWTGRDGTYARCEF